MARGRRPRPSDRGRGRAVPAPLSSGIVTRAETGPDGEWAVRHVPGGSSVKDYRCPGCDQLIPAGVGHVVTWPTGEWGSVEDRRHWHLPCWNARGRRRPGLRRPR